MTSEIIIGLHNEIRNGMKLEIVYCTMHTDFPSNSLIDIQEFCNANSEADPYGFYVLHRKKFLLSCMVGLRRNILIPKL